MELLSISAGSVGQTMSLNQGSHPGNREFRSVHNLLLPQIISSFTNFEGTKTVYAVFNQNAFSLLGGILWCKLQRWPKTPGTFCERTERAKHKAQNAQKGKSIRMERRIMGHVRNGTTP